MFLLLILIIQKLLAQDSLRRYPVYHGNDLGLSWSKSQSAFRIWSPVAVAAQLMLYKDGVEGDAYKKINLEKDSAGTWVTVQQGDLAGTFYAFRVKINGSWSNEVPDPYAKAVAVNGRRAAVIDPQTTNPPGWEQDSSPAFSATNSATDAVIYELQIRDATIAENSGVQYKGKYMGLSQGGTKSPDGLSTGLDHIRDLGITHVHLLPFFDFNSIDESDIHGNRYNWGYDPLNYNVPEGSFSSDPFDPATRIRELKKMIHSFHIKGLRVVMDVVYNHTGLTEQSNFNQLVPGYYYRHRKDGSFSDATACGNETASEKPMMRKFMLESLLYWVKEYHVDGFRFDLMGVHDIETMNIIADELHKIKPGIILYGEGWTAGESPLPDSLRALKKNAAQLRNIAVFSDDLRDGIKGSVFDIKDRGFATGKPGMEESVKSGIVAAGIHLQVNYDKVNYSKAAYTTSPAQVISYCECHDNNTLWDKISLSCTDASVKDKEKMHRLALTIVLTSQGIPFLHAGTEFMRTKKGVENSYKSADSINQLDWSLKQKNLELFHYIQSLIKLRKDHPAFRMQTAEAISSNIHFDEAAPAGTIVYTIDGKAAGDSWSRVLVVLNGNGVEKEIHLPQGKWKQALQPSANAIDAGRYSAGSYTAAIFYEE